MQTFILAALAAMANLVQSAPSAELEVRNAVYPSYQVSFFADPVVDCVGGTGAEISDTAYSKTPSGDNYKCQYIEAAKNSHEYVQAILEYNNFTCTTTTYATLAHCKAGGPITGTLSAKNTCTTLSAGSLAFKNVC